MAEAMDQDSIPRVKPDTTLTIYKKFAGIEEIDESVADGVLRSEDEIWKFLVKQWDSCAAANGRDSIQFSDIISFMQRTGMMKDYNEYSALVRDYFPFELQLELLDITQASKNKVGELSKEEQQHHPPEEQNLPPRKMNAGRKRSSSSRSPKPSTVRDHR